MWSGAPDGDQNPQRGPHFRDVISGSAASSLVLRPAMIAAVFAKPRPMASLSTSCGSGRCTPSSASALSALDRVQNLISRGVKEHPDFVDFDLIQDILGACVRQICQLLCAIEVRIEILQLHRFGVQENVSAYSSSQPLSDGKSESCIHITETLVRCGALGFAGGRQIERGKLVALFLINDFSEPGLADEQCRTACHPALLVLVFASSSRPSCKCSPCCSLASIG